MSNVVNIKGALTNINPEKFEEIREQLKSILGENAEISMPKINTGNFLMKEGSDKEATCRYCHTDFNIYSINDQYVTDAKKRGLCEECVKILHKAEEIKAIAPIKATVKSGLSRNRINPPTQKVRNVLMNNEIPNGLLQGLLDKDFTTQHTGVSFPLLKLAKDTDTTDDRRVGKFLRYSPKIIEISGNKYYLTNEIVDRHLDRIAKMFDEFGITVDFSDKPVDSSIENEEDIKNDNIENKSTIVDIPLNNFDNVDEIIEA